MPHKNKTGENPTPKDVRPDDSEAWDNQELGADEKFARRAPPEREKRINAVIDNALGLESITIRLQKDLIDSFKEFAEEEGIRYQPLIRQVLTRYARERKKSQPSQGHESHPS